MKIGAVIVAAGMSTRMKQFKQLLKIGNLTMAERVVMNFQEAGIRDIVMVTGYKGDSLRKELEYLGIRFVHNENYETTEMFESAKLGLAEYGCEYDKVFFCPVDIPFFTDLTVEKMLADDAQIVMPMKDGKTGHPIAFAGSLIPELLTYKGDRGLKGAIDACGVSVSRIEVEDKGAFMDADTREEYQKLIDLHNERMFTLTVELGISTSKKFFTLKTAKLLEGIENYGSVKEACKELGISYSKGWDIIRTAETGIGYRIVERQNGGKYGGDAYVSERGKKLLGAYRELERELQKMIDSRYSEIFFSQENHDDVDEAAVEPMD